MRAYCNSSDIKWYWYKVIYKVIKWLSSDIKQAHIVWQLRAVWTNKILGYIVLGTSEMKWRHKTAQFWTSVSTLPLTKVRLYRYRWNRIKLLFNWRFWAGQLHGHFPPIAPFISVPRPFAALFVCTYLKLPKPRGWGGGSYDWVETGIEPASLHDRRLEGRTPNHPAIRPPRAA